ncbi:MAG: cation:proton antiporter, partial [Planctomycetota bacterium]
GLSWQQFVLDLLWQLGLGGLLGAVAGWILAGLINRMYLTPSLYPVLALAGGVTTYGIAASIGSSGFLAAYIAGLVAGNTMARARHEISRFHDGMAWLAQVGLFLMLGLLVVPSELVGEVRVEPGEHVAAGETVLIAAPMASEVI